MILKLMIVWLLMHGTHETGWTSRYAPNVMNYQVEYHELETPCDGCAIAVSDCSLIGDTWLIRPYGADEWTPVIVADCAGKDALDENGESWMDKHNIIMELSYDLALRFGAMSSVRIEVIR